MAVASLLVWGLSSAYIQGPGGRTSRAQRVRKTHGEREAEALGTRTELGGINKSGVAVGPSGSGRDGKMASWDGSYHVDFIRQWGRPLGLIFYPLSLLLGFP